MLQRHQNLHVHAHRARARAWLCNLPVQGVRIIRGPMHALKEWIPSMCMLKVLVHAPGSVTPCTGYTSTGPDYMYSSASSHLRAHGLHMHGLGAVTLCTWHALTGPIILGSAIPCKHTNGLREHGKGAATPCTGCASNMQGPIRQISIAR